MKNEMIETVAKRFLELYKNDFDDSAKAEEFAKTMSPDGSWSDLDYEGATMPFWKCIRHFARLNYLAFAGKYDDQVIKGLNFWYLKERKDTNWWWNDIGIQLDLAVCGIILKDKLDADLKRKVSETFNDSISDYWTGTNRSWLAQNVIVRGMIAGEPELIHKGRKYLEDTVFISKEGEEGIQPDFAFAQHGTQLYNNGYGRALVMDVCSWIKVFEDTEFQFSKEKIDIITALLLDGCGYMGFCDVPDFNSVGRDLVRGYNGRDTRMKGYLNAIEVLKRVSPRKKELEELEKFINGDSRVFERTKMFSSLDIMAGVHNGGYASVRFGSDRVLGADVIDGKIINGEDSLSGFRGCFVSQYMVNGYEYDRIFPLWNWAFLPGVSCPETELPTVRGAVMKSSFAGGVDDGKNGVCGMDLNEDFSEGEEKVIFGGKKACFFIGGEIIHLGCGLYSKTSLNTTVNQCLFDKSYTVDGRSYGMEKYTGRAKALLHGGIAYVFDGETDITAFAEHREGEWGRITAMHEKIEIARDIFTAYIPGNKENYAYAVLLNSDENSAREYKFPEYINTENVQAVKRGDLICAVFYKAGEYKLGDSVIGSRGPSFMILKGGKVTAEKTVL